MGDVLFKRFGKTLLASLNRPKALNALNLHMIEDMTRHYQAAVQDGVELIVLEGLGGKAFCAGGDVRAIYDDRSGDTGTRFFAHEYRLNYLIGSLRIPHVALVHGIVMGGGVGVSVHGKYRVATEKTVFSMPETALGLFPDVGGSIFLPKLPSNLGTYLGLTGVRLKGYETVAAGIATHFVHSDKLEALKEALLARGVGALEAFAERDRKGDHSIAELMAHVKEPFSKNSIEDIIVELERLAASGSKWARETLELLRRMSPTSLKVTLRMLREARSEDRKACFALEFKLGQRFLQDDDFFEGVRAILVDKDNKPKWNPSSLSNVNVEKYFAPLTPEQASRFSLDNLVEEKPSKY